MWGVELTVMLAMVVVNGVFAGYEIALTSVSLARLEALLREGRPGAKAALAMKRSMERSLAVVQLGVTLCGAVAAATGGAWAEENIVPSLQGLGVPTALAEPLAIALVVVPLTALSIVLGELVPKVYSLRNKEKVCLRFSPAMVWVAESLRPVVWALEKSVALVMNLGSHGGAGEAAGGAKDESAELQELRALATLARTSKLLSPREENIIVNAARLSSRPVRESMVRAEHVCMLYADSSLAEALVAGHLDLHTRFPVTDRPSDPQAIVGYVNFKDIVACMRLAGHNPCLRSVVRPIVSLHENQPISACLERLIRDHTHIAVVRDAAEKIVGMITLEDILEEMVGEIQDEYDRMPTHLQASGTSWVAGGGVAMAKLNEITGLQMRFEEPPGGVMTLDEWLVAQLGRPVQGGDVVWKDGVLVTVRSVRRHRLNEAQLTRTEDAKPNGPGSTRGGADSPPVL